MSYEIYLPQTFQRCVKSLRKKFPHIKDDRLLFFKVCKTILKLEIQSRVGGGKYGKSGYPVEILSPLTLPLSPLGRGRG